MDEQTFFIAIDVSDDRVDHDGLRAFIKSNPDFTAWWNHIPSLYLIQTRLTADEISEQLERFTHKARYLVMRVDPQASQGWLPERSWTWITHRHLDSTVLSDQKRSS